jgi:hypothetical protein
MVIMKKISFWLLPLALCAPTISATQSLVPHSAFYLGLGGSLNATSFNNQNLEAIRC